MIRIKDSALLAQHSKRRRVRKTVGMRVCAVSSGLLFSDNNLSQRCIIRVNFDVNVFE
jgi:hypothetical protein